MARDTTTDLGVLAAAFNLRRCSPASGLPTGAPGIVCAVTVDMIPTSIATRTRLPRNPRSRPPIAS
ncbi:MAG: hypothetical protein ACLP50_26905 [Solirubrobacteraceae bacterium]